MESQKNAKTTGTSERKEYANLLGGVLQMFQEMAKKNLTPAVPSESSATPVFEAPVDSSTLVETSTQANSAPTPVLSNPFENIDQTTPDPSLAGAAPNTDVSSPSSESTIESSTIEPTNSTSPVIPSS
jgi:hypothetical protein